MANADYLHVVYRFFFWFCFAGAEKPSHLEGKSWYFNAAYIEKYSMIALYACAAAIPPFHLSFLPHVAPSRSTCASHAPTQRCPQHIGGDSPVSDPSNPASDFVSRLKRPGQRLQGVWDRSHALHLRGACVGPLARCPCVLCIPYRFRCVHNATTASSPICSGQKPRACRSNPVRFACEASIVRRRHSYMRLHTPFICSFFCGIWLLLCCHPSISDRRIRR